MSVTLIGEDPAGRRGSSNGRVNTYTRKFKLSTDNANDGPVTVGATFGLPRIGQLHNEDFTAWCVNLTVENSEPWAGWTVTAEYSSEREMNEDPTAEPARITWDSEQFQKVVVADKEGDSVCNSAGDLFDPPNMMDDSRRVVSITKNLAVVPSWILSYQDAVNSDAFEIDGIPVDIGQAKMQRVSVGEWQRRNDIDYREVSFSIHLQKDGWLLEPLDCGFRELVAFGPGLGYQNIKNAVDDEAVSAPVPLDGNGAALDNASPTDNVFLSFNVYSELPFAILPLS